RAIRKRTLARGEQRTERGLRETEKETGPIFLGLSRFLPVRIQQPVRASRTGRGCKLAPCRPWAIVKLTARICSVASEALRTFSRHVTVSCSCRRDSSPAFHPPGRIPWPPGR